MTNPINSPIQLPASSKLDIGRFSATFRKTTTTYKFYWMLAILRAIEESVKQNKPQPFRFDTMELVFSMIAMAWYPINYFNLSFGYRDMLETYIKLLKKEPKYHVDLSFEEVVNAMRDFYRNESDNRIKMESFLKYVPKCLLSPWKKGAKDKRVFFTEEYWNNCPYKLEGATNNPSSVIFNPEWVDYFVNNMKIIQDFTDWHLVQYLQRRNPNVPGIPFKLTKPMKRNNLDKQKKYWDVVIGESAKIGEPLRCIYTKEDLLPQKNYDLDHFFPWSFVSHDQLWNLIPVNPGVNRSKNNELPDLDSYLRDLASLHRKAISIHWNLHHDVKTFEDYAIVFKSHPKEIVAWDEEKLENHFKEVLVPMELMAKTMGFESNWKYNPPENKETNLSSD